MKKFMPLSSVSQTIGFDAAAITSGIGRTRDSTYGYMDDDHVYHRVTLMVEQNSSRFRATWHVEKTGTPSPTFTRPFPMTTSNLTQATCSSATVHVVAEIHLRILSQAVMTRCPLENSEFVALKFE